MWNYGALIEPTSTSSTYVRNKSKQMARVMEFRRTIVSVSGKVIWIKTTTATHHSIDPSTIGQSHHIYVEIFYIFFFLFFYEISSNRRCKSTCVLRTSYIFIHIDVIHNEKKIDFFFHSSSVQWYIYFSHVWPLN